MQLTQPVVRMVKPQIKKNLFLCLDAFDTLYKPNLHVPAAYAFAAKRHGIECVAESTASKPVESWSREEYEPVTKNFYHAFQRQTAENPNYGKAKGLGEQTWWADVIRQTFQPFLKPQQEVPSALISELISRYSSTEGYDFFPDARLLFEQLKAIRTGSAPSPTWKWDKTVVAVISNSDSRVPSVLSSFGLNVGPRYIAMNPPSTSEPLEYKDIDFVVLSYDVGVEKPNHLIFDAATSMLANMLNASPESAGLGSADDYEKLYVGDSIEKDYYGAQRAKWYAVRLNRSGKDGEDGEVRVKSTKYQGKRKRIVTVSDLNALRKWDPRDWVDTGASTPRTGAPMPRTKAPMSRTKAPMLTGRTGEGKRIKMERNTGELNPGELAQKEKIEAAMERLGI